LPLKGLIVPEWVYAWWWPMLFKGEENREVVKAWVYLPRTEGLFEDGLDSSNWFGKDRPLCNVLAVRLCNAASCGRDCVC